MPNPTKKPKKLPPGTREATMGDFLAFDREHRATKKKTDRAAKLKAGKAANRALALKRRAANAKKAAEIKKKRAAKKAAAANPFQLGG